MCPGHSVGCVTRRGIQGTLGPHGRPDTWWLVYAGLPVWAVPGLWLGLLCRPLSVVSAVGSCAVVPWRWDNSLPSGWGLHR